MRELTFSSTARVGMAITCLVFGIFTLFIGPFIIQISFEAVLNVVIFGSSTLPPTGFFYTAFVVPYFFYFYRGIGIVGGVICIIMAYYLWKGETKAYKLKKK